SAKQQRAHAHAAQPEDTKAHRGAHAADLALPARPQHETEARAAHDADLGRARDALVEPDPTAQRRERARRRLARQLDLVLALVSVARMEHTVGPVAVVREEQEPLRGRVQTTDRIEALARADAPDPGPAAPLVARGRRRAPGPRPPA